MMKIHLATDHAGFEHKEALKRFLVAQGYTVMDHGDTQPGPEDDYPDFILPAAKAVGEEDSIGVIFGGSGEGEAMCANRISGVRAVVYYGGSTEILKLSREHNNANVLSIGARFVSIEAMHAAVTLWLATPFSNDERHIRRLNKF